MDNNRTKVNVELNDMLYLKNTLKISGKELCEEEEEGMVSNYYQDPLSKHQKNLLRQEMNEWIDSIFTGLSSNVEFTDVEGAEGQAFLESSEPIDERLKSNVLAKEAERNAYFNKVVSARTNTPTLLSGITEELYKRQSDYAENLKVNLSSYSEEGEEDEENEKLEEIKKYYKSSMHTLSELKEDTPSQIYELDRLEELSDLLKNVQ